MAKLTYEQWTQLDIQYSMTPPLDEGFSASGQIYKTREILEMVILGEQLDRQRLAEARAVEQEGESDD